MLVDIKAVRPETDEGPQCFAAAAWAVRSLLRGTIHDHLQHNYASGDDLADLVGSTGGKNRTVTASMIAGELKPFKFNKTNLTGIIIAPGIAARI